MKAIHFLGNSKISIDNTPEPEPKGNLVVVKIEAAGICGTDRHPFIEHGQKTIPGHENAGIVAAVDNPSWVKEGNRVAINCHITCGSCEYCLSGNLFYCKSLQVTGFEWDGGFAEYILVPEANLHPLPDDISLDQGALLVDVFGTAYSGVKKAKINPGDHVAVWGAGPIGLGSALVAQSFGARVAIFDIAEYRLDMARQLNPELLINATSDNAQKQIRDWTNGRGLDIAFECVGNEKAALQGLGMLKPEGTLGLIGVGHNLTFDYWDLIQRQIKIYASRNFNTHEFSEMVALIQRGMNVSQMVTHHFSISDAEKAFQVFMKGDCGKIIFTSNNSFAN